MFLNDKDGLFLLGNSTDFYANKFLHFRKSHFSVQWRLDRLLFRLQTPDIICFNYAVRGMYLNYGAHNP